MKGTQNQVSADTQGADRLGFKAGQVVQEFGWGDDVDDDVRAEIEEITGSELEDEDFGDVTDGVILWWRDDDGDLTDSLVDVTEYLEDGGIIWIFTPKAGRDGHTTPGEIQDAANTAGMQSTNTFAVADDWSATRLVPRGKGR
ncbi:DUF3052 domain-containing protein [Myceligenerans crystallogenes]|uniref:DUF3052 domain-containing protein n=1 Tax=Myceligenerans crystallogenes TaxID=316335 RepID=A0ABN2NFN3_9MICO